MLTHQEHRKRLHHQIISGDKIAYVDEGEGEVILLIHGVPTSSWLYRHIIPNLVHNGYRVIAPDLLGFGASDKPKGFDVYSEQNQGLRLLELMESLNVKKWIHVCHDAGGLWTWEMLKKDTSAVAGLILLNTIIYEEGFHPPLRFKPGFIARFYTNLYKWNLSCRFMVNATLKNGLSKATSLSKKDKEGYWQPMREGTNRALYYFFTQTCRALPEYYEALLRSINVPVAIIWGTKDTILRWHPQSEKVKADLKIDPENVHLLKLSDHFSQEEMPQKVAQEIDHFIKNRL